MSGWIVQQLKDRILLDNTKLRSLAKVLGFNGLGELASGYIWNIVISYVCEDPKIIEAILSGPWRITYDSGYVMADTTVHWGHPERSISITGWYDDSDYRRSPMFVLNERNAWEAILMLTSDYSHPESEYIGICITKLRKLLYAQISSP